MAYTATNSTRDFQVGDVVRYADRINRTSGRATVVRVMPKEHATRAYRIKIDEERFERSVDEADLTAVTPTSADEIFRL
jgi:hypothetical protein